MSEYTFGDWIKSARGFHKLSYRQLAFRAGVSITQVFDLEKGNCQASIKMGKKIANVFNMELHDVLKVISNANKHRDKGKPNKFIPKTLNKDHGQ